MVTTCDSHLLYFLFSQKKQKKVHQQLPQRPRYENLNRQQHMPNRTFRIPSTEVNPMLQAPVPRQLVRRQSVLQPPNYMQPQRQQPTAAMERNQRLSYGQLAAQGRLHPQGSRRSNYENEPPVYDMEDDVEEVEMDM